MQFDRKKRFTVLIRSSPNLNKHDLEDRFLTSITMETTPEKRAAKGLRNRSLSRFTLYAPLQKHFRRFRCTCIYRLQRDVELEVPFRHELVRTFTYCTMHTQSFQSRFLFAPVFLYVAKTCCCLLNSSSRRQCQGLEGNGWQECVYIHVQQFARLAYPTTELFLLRTNSRRNDRENVFSFLLIRQVSLEKTPVKTTYISRYRPLFLTSTTNEG